MGGVTGIFQLNATLFEAEGSAAYLIWQNLMVFANIGMIIILLVIIFSQLTGYGIDNYGIKKMLPKLIVTAVLINLSFLLCQIAIDLSNIIGKGLVGLAKDIRTNVAVTQGSIGAAGVAEVTFASLFTILFGGAAATSAAAGVITTAVLSGPLWFIPLIFVVLAGLVALLIFFLLLATRQLLAVILVTVAPIAMLCYILPNTQKIFKKWLDLFKAILIIYPVCAGLYGISVLMKIIAFRAEGIHILMAMVAMLMTFLPLYAAPLLIKKALAGFDMIGGMLTGMGEKVKGGLKNAEQAFRSSDVYKEAQEQGERKRAERRVAAFDAVKKAREGKGKATLKQRLRSRMAGGERGYAKTQAFLDKSQREDKAARAIIAEKELAGVTMPELETEWNKAFDMGDEKKLDALTTVGMNRYGSAFAKAIGDNLATKNIVDNQGKVINENATRSLRTLQDNMNHNSNFANAMRAKDSAAFSMISDAGLRYDKTTGQSAYANMEYFDANNNVATDLKDWSTHSSSALQRAIDAKTLDQDTINELLTSTDPAIQSGIQSDKSKRDVLQAALYNMQHNPSGVGPSLPREETAKLYRQEQVQKTQSQETAKQQQRDDMAKDLREINQQLRQFGGPKPQGGGSP